MLKVDRSFVSRMDDSCEGSKNLEIVRSIAMLANSLGMELTAEGVETAEQRRLLQALDCKYGQGYFFSKPLDSASAEVLISNSTQP
jgi:EAL domain-containing protein (putative c-di-GMP-specific phosphodiesterase class I)